MKEVARTFIRKLLPAKHRHKLWKSFTKIQYFGCRYKCPFCKSHLRIFLPSGLSFPVLTEKKVIGGGYRENVLCPVCDSQDRERLVYLYLMHKTDIFRIPGKLLHIAPEIRLETVFRTQENIDYLTADINPENVMVKMDITNIQYPDNSFDFIICNHVLEHVVEDKRAMSELFRILKRGGWAILQVPISQALKNTYEDFSIKNIQDREKAFGQGDHVRIYANDYKNRLSKAGFEVHIFKWISEANNFGGPQNKFGLNKKECLYFAQKP